MTNRLRVFATLLLISAAADAHEYWLLPDRFAAAPGDEIGIVHRVGTGWPGENLPRDPRRVVRFAFIDRKGERPIEGAPGADPAGTIALRTTGLAMAVYRSNPSRISLEPALFESYLRDEGLDDVIAWRAAHGESALPGEEMFSRNAKAMVVATDDGASPARLSALTARDARLWRRSLGLTLEIVAETDPRQLASGAPFTVRVLYLGKPLAGALVKTFPEGSVVTESRVRTDASGRATMTLGKPGVWLVNTVHMIDAPAGSGARWQSLWSSLVFEVDR
ncbi:MAG: DUF4198 domain-containing protein [Caldimonas sp.]